MGAEVSAAFEAGRLAHPDVQVDAGAFEAALAARGGDGSEALAHAEDLFLAVGCAAGNKHAIEELTRLLRKVAARVLRTPSARGIDGVDLEQQVLERLLTARVGKPPRILEYGGRGSLGSWLKVTATRIRLDSERKRADKARRLTTSDQLGIEVPQDDPELAYLKANYREEFRVAFRKGLEALSARQRNLLRHSVTHGLSATEIARLYGVHRATAKRWLAQTREELLDQTRATLRDALGLSAPEFDSVMRLIQSRLEVSIRHYLGSMEASRQS